MKRKVYFILAVTVAFLWGCFDFPVSQDIQISTVQAVAKWAGENFRDRFPGMTPRIMEYNNRLASLRDNRGNDSKEILKSLIKKIAEDEDAVEVIESLARSRTVNSIIAGFGEGLKRR